MGQGSSVAGGIPGRGTVSRSRPICLGIVADTHGLFDPAILRHFRGVDRILHAGDIGQQSVIDQLRHIAPVTAVSGNIDGFERSGFPTEIILEVAGLRIAIRHIVYEGGKLTRDGGVWLDREQPDICIFGHTHQPKSEWRGKTLLFNPGSAGPKRFSFPRAVGVLRLVNGRVIPRHIALTPRLHQNTAMRCIRRRPKRTKGRG